MCIRDSLLADGQCQRHALLLRVLDAVGVLVELKAAYIKAAKAGKSIPHKAGFRLAFRSIAQMAQATACLLYTSNY